MPILAKISFANNCIFLVEANISAKRYLNFLKLRQVRNGLAPDYIRELFNLANKGYSLRNADFEIPRYSTVRYGKHSISYLGP